MSVDVYYVALSYLRLTIPQKDPLHNQNYTNDHFLPICVLLASSASSCKLSLPEDTSDASTISPPHMLQTCQLKNNTLPLYLT